MIGWLSRVGLGHLGRVGLFRQAADHAGDAVAHVVGGVVDVAVQRELDGHAGTAVTAGRGDPLDALDAGDLLLDRLGDAVLDDLGRGPGIGLVLIETTGGSTSGSSRTGRKKKAAAPMTHRTMAATAAKTGRRTATSESIIGRRPGREPRRPAAAARASGRAPAPPR
jgi:hypothetical protein